MTLAGSPGAAWMRKKFTTMMANTITTIFTTRAARKRANPAGPIQLMNTSSNGAWMPVP